MLGEEVRASGRGKARRARASHRHGTPDLVERIMGGDLVPGSSLRPRASWRSSSRSARRWWRGAARARGARPRRDPPGQAAEGAPSTAGRSTFPGSRRTAHELGLRDLIELPAHECEGRALAADAQRAELARLGASGRARRTVADTLPPRSLGLPRADRRGRRQPALVTLQALSPRSRDAAAPAHHRQQQGLEEAITGIARWRTDQGSGRGRARARYGAAFHRPGRRLIAVPSAWRALTATAE